MTFDASDLPSGIYYYQLSSKNYTATVSELKHEVSTLNSNLEKSRNELQSTQKEYETLLNNLVSRRMEMKGLVTPEEWETISGKRKKSILTNE